MKHYLSAAKNCRLGDVIDPFEQTDTHGNPYMHCTVLNITPQGVKVLRPYVQTADFTYTGGVIGYLGYEEYTLVPETIVTVIAESHIPDIINHETDEGRLERSGVAERRRLEAFAAKS